MKLTSADGKANLSWRFAVFAVSGGFLFGMAALWGANKQILGLFHDDAIYTVVAKSIYHGDGYRIISLPSAPAQTKYPFLYSYVLSLVWAIYPSFPQNIVVLKALNSVILAAVFILSLALYRRHFPGAQLAAFVFAVLVSTNPIIFTYTDYVVSDLLFVLLGLGALVLWRVPMGSPTEPAKLWLVTLLTGLACLTRLAAAPLAFAGAVVAFIERGTRGVLYFSFGVLLFVTPWLWWVALHTDHSGPLLLAYYSAYDFTGANTASGEWLSRHGPVVAGNARYLLDSLDLVYLLPLVPWLAPVVAALSFVGMIVSARRQEVFAWTFFSVSLGLLLVWPFHPGRYLAPLVPLLLLFFFLGMATVERWIAAGCAHQGRLIARLAWTPAALILLLNGVWLSSYLLIPDKQTTRGLYGRRMPYGWAGFEESFAWIRQHTAANARLATAYDPMYFLYTGRQAIRPALHRPASYFYPYGKAQPDVGSVKQIMADLQMLNINYLVIDPLDGYAEGEATLNLLDDLVAAYGKQAKNVFNSTDGKHRIYALTKE